MPDYRNLTRDELLNLAQNRDQLIGDARVAFDSELSVRSISQDEVGSYARETISEERKRERRIQRSERSYWGRRFLGKKSRYHDPRKRIEEFDTTLWLVCGFPVFPIASYRVRRPFRRWWNQFPSQRIHILKEHPRDWGQILDTWARTAAVLLLMVALVTSKIRHR